MARLTAFLAGLLFALGLGVSGMTQPAKVVGFLDFFGRWDPSLIAVLFGAVAVHAVFARRALGSGRPWYAPRFELTSLTRVDARLVAGSALFGVGWGISGLCPGPALVSSVAFVPTTLAFVAAMLGGIALFRVMRGDPASDQTVQASVEADTTEPC